MYSERMLGSAGAKPALDMSSPLFKQVTENQEDRRLYESATQELYAQTPDSNPAKRHNMLKATINGRVPQSWMSMTRTAKIRSSPAGSVAPDLKRQSEALHSSSSYQDSFQQPRSEASSSSDTVETAQLALAPRQPQLALNTRLPHSEGLFGRERAQAMSAAIPRQMQAVPNTAQAQRAISGQNSAAASVQQPASALDRFNARKSMSRTADIHSSAQTQSGAVQPFQTLQKRPATFGRPPASPLPEVPVQYASASTRVAGIAKPTPHNTHQRLYSDRLTDASQQVHSTLLPHCQALQRHVSADRQSNRTPAGLDRVNAKLEARRKLRVSQSGPAAERLEKANACCSVPSTTAARLALPSNALHASDDCHEQSNAGLGRMRCDEVKQQQERMGAGPASFELTADARAMLLSNRLRPGVGAESTCLANADSSVPSLGSGRMHSDIAQQARSALVSDRVQHAGASLVKKSHKRMYQDAVPARVGSIEDRLGSPALFKRVRSSTLPMQTQTTHRSSVLGRLREQPI